MCTGLWTACADTPKALCAGWGCGCGNSVIWATSRATTCANAAHGLCTKSFLVGAEVVAERRVIHTGNLTSNVSLQDSQDRLHASCGCAETPRETILLGIVFEHVFDYGGSAKRADAAK